MSLPAVELKQALLNIENGVEMSAAIYDLLAGKGWIAWFDPKSGREVAQGEQGATIQMTDEGRRYLWPSAGS